jgi:hypothetical protein
MENIKVAIEVNMAEKTMPERLFGKWPKRKFAVLLFLPD